MQSSNGRKELIEGMQMTLVRENVDDDCIVSMAGNGSELTSLADTPEQARLCIGRLVPAAASGSAGEPSDPGPPIRSASPSCYRREAEVLSSLSSVDRVPACVLDAAAAPKAYSSRQSLLK